MKLNSKDQVVQLLSFIVSKSFVLLDWFLHVSKLLNGIIRRKTLYCVGFEPRQDCVKKCTCSPLDHVLLTLSQESFMTEVRKQGASTITTSLNFSIRVLFVIVHQTIHCHAGDGRAVCFEVEFIRYEDYDVQLHPFLWLRKSVNSNSLFFKWILIFQNQIIEFRFFLPLNYLLQTIKHLTNINKKNI